MIHDRPCTILRTVVAERPCFSAMAFVAPVALCSARMVSTIAAVSLWARFGLVKACRTPRASAWRLFSASVLHSRLSTRLSALSPFLWFTTGRSGSGDRKCSATKRCAKNHFSTPLADSPYWTYPLRLTKGFSTVGRSPAVEGEIVRSRPASLISYRGNPKTGFQVSTVQPPGYSLTAELYHTTG